MRLTPVARAVALLVVASSAQAAPVAFSSGWFSAKGTTMAQTRVNGVASGMAGSALSAGQAQQRLQQSINNLNRTAAAIAAAQASQAAARQAAIIGSSSIPDGLASAGLQVDGNPLTAGWINAQAPQQSVAGGQTTVTVKQTAQKAILDWSSFNIGRHTTLYFNQSDGTQNDGSNDWIALNRINDPQQQPSQILGQIKAEGTVYVLNRNGIVFGAGSQVNTQSLLVSSMNLFSTNVNLSNQFFLAAGIGQIDDPGNILNQGGTDPATLLDGAHLDQTTGNVVYSGSITVENGASITAQPQGYVLLAAPQIQQSGEIIADGGSVSLASAIAIRLTQSGGALTATDLSGQNNDVQTWTAPIQNSGVIQARRGQIQLTGTLIEQDGVLLSSTSVGNPGRVELDGFTTGHTLSTVTLGTSSIIALLPEMDGATTSSSAAADSSFQTSTLNINANQITLNSSALIEAPSGNVTLTAADATFANGPVGRVYIDKDAVIDVSGLADVELPMSALLVTVPRIGQNELADSPLLRDSFLYTQKNVVIDSSLSGVRADGLDWVGSPILDVAGYVQNVARTVDQLMIGAGNITLASAQVIARTGSQLLLNGGYINYLPGYITTPNLLGANGLIYNIGSADPTIDYVGFAGQYTVDHSRWGVSETYSNPLLAGLRRWDDGFIEGGEAGALTIGGNDVSGVAVLNGDLSAQAVAGRNQVAQANAPQGGSLAITGVSLLVNYQLVDNAVPLETTQPQFDATTTLAGTSGTTGSSSDPDQPAPVPAWFTLSTGMIERGGFSKVQVSTWGHILLDDATHLVVTPGGEIDLTGARVEVNGTLQAAGGTIKLASNGNIAPAAQGGNGPTDGIFVGATGDLNARGSWVNDSQNPAGPLTGDQTINGGNIFLVTYQNGAFDDGTPDITLAQGSLLDVSSGGYVGSDGQLAMSSGLPLGRGGNITLATHLLSAPDNFVFALSAPDTVSGGSLQLDGQLQGFGFSGGGTLTLEASQIQIGGTPAPSSSASLLYLPADFFTGQGFANYRLTAETDASIAPGSIVNVTPANLLPNNLALLGAPTGADIFDGGLTTIGTLSPYQREQTATAGAAGFSLTSGLYRGWGSSNNSFVAYPGVSGSLTVGAGAVLSVDPGAAVALQSTVQLNVFGAIVAPGGSIDLSVQALSFAKDIAPARSIWLGGQSLLDASGVSLIDPLAAAVSGANGSFIPRTGVVLGGGDVTLVSDRYEFAQAGALIDVSGVSDTYDLPGNQTRFGLPGIGTVSTPVWSDAGSITLAASGSLLFDATLMAHAGAPEAAGGSLMVAAYQQLSNQSALNAKAVILQQSGDLLPAGLQPGDALSDASFGLMRFAIDRLDGSGIDNFTVGPTPGDAATEGPYRAVPLVFAGNVDLVLPRSVVFNASAYIAAPSGTITLPSASAPIAGAGTVSISAPYVYLADSNGATTPVALTGDGTLAVHAGFLDLGGKIDLQGFAQADFDSDSDLRFYLPAVDAYQDVQPLTGWLYSSGNLDFTATRLYPETNYSFLIDADSQGAAETTVSFHGNGQTDATTPLSASGTLAVAASHIVQGGTLWVPSGNIVLGVGDAPSERTALGLSATFPLSATQSVQLAPGSVTSVSLAGQILPYGSTVDGVQWLYDADPAVAGAAIDAPPAKQISINGDQISLQQGATIDLSGGGDLQAVEWTAGTGGSRDVLSQYQTNYANSTTGVQVPQYSDGRAVYAILPGYSAPLSAQDPALEKGAGAGPAVGQAVYLSGVAGLPAGIYTLLPAKYATLPGAYRVVQDTAIHDAVLGQTATLADGTQVVAGYFADALTGSHSARNTDFEVQSSATWQQYSQYTTTLASQFFPVEAQHAGNIVPPLPADAGRLVLAAGHELDLNTTLTAATSGDGRGAQVDITGQAIQIVAGGSATLDGYLAIDANALSALGASSLLIGGTRSATDDGDLLDVSAHSIVLSNDAAHPLSGPEVILATDGSGSGIELDAGSVLQATGSVAGAQAVPLIMGRTATDTVAGSSGDGALLRVSNGTVNPIVRNDVTGVDGPAGVAGGALTIGAGAVIDGGASLSLDATGDTHMAADAVLSAQAIDVTANRISFVGNNAAADEPGLLLGPATLGQFNAAESVTLRSRGTIDFIGNIDVAIANDLNLSATALTGDGGQVTIEAGKLALSNDLGGPAATFAAGNGTLTINAGELDFGAGALTLQGFGGVTAAATQGIAAQGSGDINFGTLAVTLTAPVFLADTGANLNLHTTGALNLSAGPGTALTREALAGALSLSGGSMNVSMNVLAPAGTITLQTTGGDLVVNGGAQLSVAGISKPFNDTQAYAPGGMLTLAAGNGNIRVAAGTTLDVAGAAAGGNAGHLTLQAPAGAADLQGTLLGSATNGYLGGVFTLDTGAAADLNALADTLNPSGMNGLISIHTGAGDLTLSADRRLTAHSVSLTADGGGWVRIDGTVDASGDFGGPINLYGQGGVDIEGALLANATAAGRTGGDISLGTSGTGDGTLNTAYGYENVQAANSGTIQLGSAARLELEGDGGNGSLNLRAPLLANGDVNIHMANNGSIVGASAVTVEAYATWSTADASANKAQHFDGLIDPAGWYAYDQTTGLPQLVAGHFTDFSGNPVTDPDRSNAAQMADYLAKYIFTPDAANTDHQGFYGYVNGDASQGPGALMGFIEAPGFAFESRFAGLANFHARPGVDLVNPDQTVNQGNIAVLSNWNLAAGSQNADDTLSLVYRYGDQAPVLNLRAANNLVIAASITDGFFQISNIAATPAPHGDFSEATLAWDQVQTNSMNDIGNADYFSAPVDLTSSDPVALQEYYGEYIAYAKYLTGLAGGNSGLEGLSVVDVLAYGLSGLLAAPQSIPGAPTPPPAATMLAAYPNYLASYATFLNAATDASDFADNFFLPDTVTTLAPPPTTLDRLVLPPPPVDNSPSPLRSAANPMPLPSATLAGGSSSTYRLVAGADTSSADPMAVQASNIAGSVSGAAPGQLSLDGHIDFTDFATNRVVVAPMVVRTGTGDIDIAAAGDIRWLDTVAPAAIYTGGAPAPGTAASATATLLALKTGDLFETIPELVQSGPVNPVDGGNISLTAGGDIVAIQQVFDTGGSITGVAGQSISQYWWPWMQTSNSNSRSSINFGAFDQGLMSVGGNINVSAGGDIRQLSASLPTTWYVSTDAGGNSILNTVGGGNLDVSAGGNILGGSYFVARGTGTLTAGGRIGADPDGATAVSGATQPTPAVLLALQDAQMQVQAGSDVDIGGVYDPSWLTLDASTLATALPAGHFDGQSYSAASSLSAISIGGDLTYGSASDSLSFMFPGQPSNFGANPEAIMPATIAFTALSGDLNILAPGELYPSANGNLTMLANGSISFEKVGDSNTNLQAWGLIDAPASSLPSALNPVVATLFQSYILGAETSATLAGELHQTQALHGADATPVRIYALNGDIIDGAGGADGAGGGLDSLYIVPSKPALIEAGRDIVDLVYIGQQTHASDVSVIEAGRDIYDIPLAPNASLSSAGGYELIMPVLAQGGPGTLVVQAGRDIGHLASQTELLAIPPFIPYSTISFNGTTSLTGIDSIGNALNPNLPYEGSSIQTIYGVAPGINQAGFISSYVNPAAGVAGVPSLTPDLITFMQNYDAGLVVDTGYAKDKQSVTLDAGQAWAQFQTLPDYVQRLFVDKALFKILATVGADFNDPASAFQGQYARGYDAISTLFPAALGYTDNGNGQGGINGAQQTVDTGNLDLRGSTIQTQQGGNISLLAPGGQALLGSTSAPPVVANSQGAVVAGPNSMGLLTLRQGDIDILTDRSVLLAQSRIFTEQGGAIVAWSSNGDINAGKGAKTTAEIPPASYLCDLNFWCRVSPAGEVSGAGIGTLQTIPGAPVGDAFLMAPRGTVDAGDAGIRVSGNLTIAAALVANADNIQVQGKSSGIPIIATVNTSALTSASAAASAAADGAQEVTRQQQAAARQSLPSIITVQVLGFGNDPISAAQPVSSSDAAPKSGQANPISYNPTSSVVILGLGGVGDTQRARLTGQERSQLGGL